MSAIRATCRMPSLAVLVVLTAALLTPMPDSGASITAAWMIEENARPGTTRWQISNEAPRDVEGFADHVSAEVGDVVRLFVDTTAPSFHVEAYRLGWYGGDGGRSVWVSPEQEGTDQPAPTMKPMTHMVEADWARSLAFRVGPRWVQGVYVLKLVASTGGQGYIPLVIRDDASAARIVVKQTVTTWQAYNRWGGASLYEGPSGDSSDRATHVSFDRPYLQSRGAGRTLDDLPLISLVERRGVDVTYVTDVDLHERPSLLQRHHALLSPEHDEYWSTAMRRGLTAARAAGVNLAFFGANAVYWHVRFEDSPLGRNRRIVCYKSAAKDPLAGVDDAEVTVKWRDPPLDRPESALLGSMYGCYGVEPQDLLVGDAGSWVFAGTGLDDGDAIPDVLSGEVDWVWPDEPTPGNLQILAHSRAVCGDGTRVDTDMIYYTARSGAGVFHTGSIGWLEGMGCGPVSDDPHCEPSARGVTLNVIRTFARRPAGIAHPSRANAEEFGYELTHPTSP